MHCYCNHSSPIAPQSPRAVYLLAILPVHWPLAKLALVSVQGDFGTLALHGQVVAELALVALGALVLAEELAHYGLRVNT